MLPHETPDTPTPTGPGVWLPLSMAIRVLDCYFGTGPRHNAEPLPSPAADSGGDPAQNNGETLPYLRTYTYPENMHPQGLARKERQR